MGPVMTTGFDEPQGPGWWRASNGKYYPPTKRPRTDVSDGHPGPASAPLGPDWWLAADGKWYPGSRPSAPADAALPDLRDRQSTKTTGSLGSTGNRASRWSDAQTAAGSGATGAATSAASAASAGEANPVEPNEVAAVASAEASSRRSSGQGFVARDITTPRSQAVTDSDTLGALARRIERRPDDTSSGAAIGTHSDVATDADQVTAESTDTVESSTIETTKAETAKADIVASTGAPASSAKPLQKIEPSDASPGGPTTSAPEKSAKPEPSSTSSVSTGTALPVDSTRTVEPLKAGASASTSDAEHPTPAPAPTVASDLASAPKTTAAATDPSVDDAAAKPLLPPPPKLNTPLTAEQPAPIDLNPSTKSPEAKPTLDRSDAPVSHTPLAHVSAEAAENPSPSIAAGAAMFDLPPAAEQVTKSSSATPTKTPSSSEVAEGSKQSTPSASPLPRQSTTSGGSGAPPKSKPISSKGSGSGWLSEIERGDLIGDHTIDLRGDNDLSPAAAGPRTTNFTGGASTATTAPSTKNTGDDVVVERPRPTIAEPEGPRRGPVILLALGIVAALGVIFYLATRNGTEEPVARSADAIVEDDEAGSSSNDGAEAEVEADESTADSDPTVDGAESGTIRFEESSPAPSGDEAVTGDGQTPVPFGDWGSLSDNIEVRVVGHTVEGANPPTAVGEQSVSIGVEVQRAGAGNEAVEASWRLLSPSNAIYDLAPGGCGGSFPSPSTGVDSSLTTALCWPVAETDADFEELLLLVQAEGDEFPNVFGLAAN